MKRWPCRIEKEGAYESKQAAYERKVLRVGQKRARVQFKTGGGFTGT